MRVIDTHSHIYQQEFNEDIDQVILRAQSAGVEKILLPNIDADTIKSLHSLCEAYKDYCLPMMGLHPTSVDAGWKDTLKLIREQFTHYTYIAVGEVGLDLYWDKTFEEQQKLVFEEQLQWSIDYDLPVVIHSRDAIPQCIECIERVESGKLRGVFHSFGGNEEELESILALGNFMLGINGVLTFKNSTLPIVLKNTDLSHIIIETDAPYLAPMPYRGKRNEPSYTIRVVDKLAAIYSMEAGEVGKITTDNAKRLFNLKN